MSAFASKLAYLALVSSSVLVVCRLAAAKETDQFTTPKRPLADIGAVLSRKIVTIIESDGTGNPPERVLSHWVGHSVVESRLASWVKELRAADGPVYYRPRLAESIYRKVYSPVPAGFAVDAPTVRIHGYNMGTDKLDHFFQQGYQYFEIVASSEAKGSDDATAFAAAVAHGVKQEHRYYGTLASGVYSNADLAANYAGMKFYLNLRHPVRIGGTVWPPLFERSAAGWRLRPGIDPGQVLAPFFSHHLDESLNPSRYRFGRGLIRSRVHNRCAQWAEYNADRVGLATPVQQSFAVTWFGEDYGHWLPPSEEISIATECPAVTLERSRSERESDGMPHLGGSMESNHAAPSNKCCGSPPGSSCRAGVWCSIRDCGYPGRSVAAISHRAASMFPTLSAFSPRRPCWLPPAKTSAGLLRRVSPLRHLSRLLSART